MIIHPDVLTAHAEFGGDLELMQKAYEWSELKAEIERLRLSLSEASATGRREGLSEAGLIAVREMSECGDVVDFINGMDAPNETQKSNMRFYRGGGYRCPDLHQDCGICRGYGPPRRGQGREGGR